MAASLRRTWYLLVLLGAGAPQAHAQPDGGEVPAVFAPAQPPSQQDLDRRLARKHFGLALLCQRQDRLLEALQNLEEARRLDPAAAAVSRALIPLYLAVGRTEDALAAGKRTLELTPDDFEIWYMVGRQHKDQGRPQEALAALERGQACHGIHEQLDTLVQLQFEIGLLHEDAKQYAKAETAFREVLKVMVDKREGLLDLGPFSPEQLDQETAKTWERVGHVCLKAGKHEQAVSAFGQAQKSDPERAGRLSYNLAQVCLEQARPADALRHLDDYLRTQPQGAQAYELKIDILKKLRRDLDIVPALEQAAARDTYNVELHLLLARQYVREKAWAQAEKLYLNLADGNPTAEVYRGLFAMQRERGTVVKVLDLLDQTLKTARDNDDEQEEAPNPANFAKTAAAAARARAMLPVLRDDAELVKALLLQVQNETPAARPRGRDTTRFLAVLAARTKQSALAERLFRACLATLTPQTEAEVYSGLLDVLVDQRKHQEIIALCEEGLKKTQATNRLLFFVKLAPAQLSLGKTDEALAAAEEAVKLADDSNRLRLRRFRVEMLRQAEKYESALTECQALLKEYHLRGEVHDIRYSLSNVYSSANEHAKAEEQLRLILEADPNDATANNDLGYIMADKGKNLEESEKLIRKAIDLDLAEKKHGKNLGIDGAEANAAYIDSLGWVLFRLGKLEEARTQLEKAAKLAGGEEDPVVWDHLGDVYFKLEQTAQARTAWEKSVQLYEQAKRRRPDDRCKEVKHKLQTLGATGK